MVAHPAGNLLEALDEWTGAATGIIQDRQCYRHDYLQQLTEAWTPATTCATGPTQSGLSGPAPYWAWWIVDAIGRVVARTDKTPSTSTFTTFTHPNAGVGALRPHGVTGSVTTTGSTVTSHTYTYDQAGNVTSRPGPGGNQHTLIWDDLGNLIETLQGTTTLARMIYDMAGNRILRQENATTTLYLGEGELTLTGATMSAQRYYTFNGHTVAMRTGVNTATVSTLISDWQGTIHAQIRHNTGAVTINWQDPYGQPRGQTGSTWVGQRGFVGGIKDANGLTRIGARDYDPWLGAFITTDPIHHTSGAVHLNAYRYAFNNPTTLRDPTGLAPEKMVSQLFQKTVDTLTTPVKIVEPIPTPPTPKPPTPTPAPTPGTENTVKPGGFWYDFWNVASTAALVTPTGIGNAALSQIVGGVASGLAQTIGGATCYWEASVKMTVCWGASPSFAARGGTTYGHTFISTGSTDPRDLGGYMSLMEHEAAHAMQQDTIGPGNALSLVLRGEGLRLVLARDAGCTCFIEWSADRFLGTSPVPRLPMRRKRGNHVTTLRARETIHTWQERARTWAKGGSRESCGSGCMRCGGSVHGLGTR